MELVNRSTATVDVNTVMKQTHGQSVPEKHAKPLKSRGLPFNLKCDNRQNNQEIAN